MSLFLKDDERGSFSRLFNRECFTFDHTLHRSNAFDLVNLIEASKRLPDSYHASESAAVDDGWTPRARTVPLSLYETMATIEQTNSLVMLKGLATDPDYASIVSGVLRELEDAVGAALQTDALLWRATIIVSSPHRVTPYHIDGEANFLFQLRGEKFVNVFDHADRTLVTNEELERFYGGDASAARYRADRQSDALAFPFAPGQGVHVPLHAPHWVRNGDGVSIAMSVNCTLKSGERLAQLYRFNHLMRRSGLAPAEPGESAWRDRIKLAATGGLRLARQAASSGLSRKR